MKSKKIAISDIVNPKILRKKEKFTATDESKDEDKNPKSDPKELLLIIITLAVTQLASSSVQDLIDEIFKLYIPKKSTLFASFIVTGITLVASILIIYFTFDFLN